MESNSHKDLFIGILDKNGVAILKTSKIKVTDSRDEHIGGVIWKNGSYLFQGDEKTYCAYNIYAWRRNIEVIDNNAEPLFNIPEMQEELKTWEYKKLTFMQVGEVRLKFREGFELGYKSAIESKHLNNLL